MSQRGSPSRHSIGTLPARPDGVNENIQSEANLVKNGSHSPLLGGRMTGDAPSRGSPAHKSISSFKQEKSSGTRSPFKVLPVQSYSGHNSDSSAASQSPAVGASYDEETASQGAGTSAGLSESPVFTGQRSRSEGKLCTPGQMSEKEKLTPPNASGSKLSKHESLKVQKKVYRKEKKRAAKELLFTLKDPTVIIMGDWLKIRGTLKSWTKLWCVLKPGLFLLYKSHKQKSSHWVGTILLNTCELLERPSKKDGFCFKLFHPLEQSIWATKGPKGESIGAITQPLPYSYLIFRAPSEAAGKCWMDALELVMRCSSLLMRTMTKDRDASGVALDQALDQVSLNQVDQMLLSPYRGSATETMNESDCERHFRGVGDDEYKTDREEMLDDKSERSENSDSEERSDEEEELAEKFNDDLQPIETPYIENEVEELGQQGDACQTEVVEDENKSLIWSLVKQVRPGMDLSKVVLPTFILEPRSFLDKLSDYYYHADFLSKAVLDEDPYSRMKSIVRWYLSGFYKKPKGLKKPYNPILGETFRCCWRHPDTKSRTFFIAEQVSHHPPVSAFFVTNRQDGFSISGSVLAKSKFYGNSVSAIMDGMGRLTLLKRGEDYLISMPYAHCKGIMVGTLTMELGGKVSITCEKTGYHTELEFKLKPFFGSGEASNKITGKFKLGHETLATLEGKWDQEIYIKEKLTGETNLFWNPTPEIKSGRLKRYTVPIEVQMEYESERLWRNVSIAINSSDQNSATEEKHVLEEAQRREARERKAKLEEWMPRNFERDPITLDWVYKYADLRPWDPMNDLLQYEHDYIVTTKTRHRTPVVRTTSITNVDEPTGPLSRKSSIDTARVARIKRSSLKHIAKMAPVVQESGSSTPDPDVDDTAFIYSGESKLDPGKVRSRSSKSAAAFAKALDPLVDSQKQLNERIGTVQNQLSLLSRRLNNDMEASFLPNSRDLFLVGAVLLIQVIIFWIFRK